MIVKITETLEKFVEVDAKGRLEELQIAENNYRAADDDYVLTAVNFTEVSFEVVND